MQSKGKRTSHSSRFDSSPNRKFEISVSEAESRIDENGRGDDLSKERTQNQWPTRFDFLPARGKYDSAKFYTAARTGDVDVLLDMIAADRDLDVDTKRIRNREIIMFAMIKQEKSIVESLISNKIISLDDFRENITEIMWRAVMHNDLVTLKYAVEACNPTDRDVHADDDVIARAAAISRTPNREMLNYLKCTLGLDVEATEQTKKSCR